MTFPKCSGFIYFSKTSPGLEIAILQFHDFSSFFMTAWTLQHLHWILHSGDAMNEQRVIFCWRSNCPYLFNVQPQVAPSLPNFLWITHLQCPMTSSAPVCLCSILMRYSVLLANAAKSVFWYSKQADYILWSLFLFCKFISMHLWQWVHWIKCIAMHRCCKLWKVVWKNEQT